MLHKCLKNFMKWRMCARVGYDIIYQLIRDVVMVDLQITPSVDDLDKCAIVLRKRRDLIEKRNCNVSST